MAEMPATNGEGAAAIMALAVGALALGLFTITGDAFAAVAAFFNIWKPTGPLSGVTALAIIVWLAAWFVFYRLWNGRDVRFGRVNAMAAVLVVMGLLLTFPPFMDFLQGR